MSANPLRIAARHDQPAAPRALEGVYTDDHGSLRYRLCVSARLRARPPLLVMLHGASQSAADFATGTRMQDVVDECGGIALFPEQSRSAHPLGSWNWYDARHQAAEGGEPSLIAGLTHRIAALHGADRRRIDVAGKSCGGAMAVIVGQAFPGVFAAMGVHSGLPTGAARDLLSALRTMNSGPADEQAAQPRPSHAVPTIVFHGNSDTTVHPRNPVAVWMQARQRGLADTTPADVLSRQPEMGVHGRTLRIAFNWLSRFACSGCHHASYVSASTHSNL